MASLVWHEELTKGQVSSRTAPMISFQEPGGTVEVFTHCSPALGTYLCVASLWPLSLPVAPAPHPTHAHPQLCGKEVWM